MRPSGKRQNDLVNKALRPADEDQVATKRSTPVLTERVSAAAVASGKATRVEHIKHPPARIRAWAGHNRNYDLLSEARCADLIEGFQQPLGQQFPAIVRVVRDSKDYDYEFICGARRHWTAIFLKMDLLIEPRDLDDKEAFLLQDIENRDREDVSDHERAMDYLKALPMYFDGKASAMANELNIDKGNFSRMLALAEVPTPIVEAYGDIRELVVRHGSVYLKLCKDKKAKERILKAAYRLKGQNLKGTEVLRKLSAAAAGTAKQKSVAAPSDIYSDKYISVKQGGAGDYTVKFNVPSEDNQPTIEAVRKSFLAMLDKLEADAPTTNRDGKSKKDNKVAAAV